MKLMWWIVIILGGYFVIVQGLARLVVPHLGSKKPLPEKVPTEWTERIKDFNKLAKNDLEYLKLCYDYVSGRFYVSRLLSVLKLQYAWRDPFSFKSGHMPYTLQNYLLRLMLVKSGRFKEEEIKVETVPFNLWIHQYLKVKVDGQWMYIDPGGRSLGKKFGERAIWWG